MSCLKYKFQIKINMNFTVTYPFADAVLVTCCLLCNESISIVNINNLYIFFKLLVQDFTTNKQLNSIIVPLMSSFKL